MRFRRRKKLAERAKDVAQEVLADMEEAGIIGVQNKNMDVKKVRNLLTDYRNFIEREEAALAVRAEVGDLPVLSVSVEGLMSGKVSDIEAAIKYLDKYDWVGVDG